MTNSVLITTAVVAFGVTTLLGILLIPVLKRLNFGQTIREDGPIWHKSKQNTPTMGGLIFIIGISVAIVAGYLVSASTQPNAVSAIETGKLFLGLAMAIMFSAIGFADDYIKVIKKRNLGLTALQKIILQSIVAAVSITIFYFLNEQSTAVVIPFIGIFDLKIFYFPIMGVLIIGVVNAVNLTDGIDGLCSSVTFVVSVFFMIVTAQIALVGQNIFATALAAGCIGFLVYNLHPAKLFMGDTGSFFFGGAIVAMSFGIGMEFLVFFVGFVYCFEALSVILQVISYKTTGKRIFKMSPVHHHFEMCGWSENKIVIVFSIVAVLTCALGYAAVYAAFMS